MPCHFRHIVLVFGAANVLWSQNPGKEIAGFEYSVIPDIGETSIEKYSMNLNLDKKIDEKGVIGFGVSYDYYNFMFDNSSLDLDATAYERIHNIKASIFYKHFINTSWSANLVLSPSLSSSFDTSIDNEDFIINSSVTLSKSWTNRDKEALLTFGVDFGTTFGKPQLIPVISFKKNRAAKWSYALGFPQTRVHYTFDVRHRISADAGFNGLFGNVSSTVDFLGIGSLHDTKLQYNSMDTSLEYNYRIQPNWTTLIKVGYSPWNQLKILDKENNELYDITANGSMFISMGLKFNLNK